MTRRPARLRLLILAAALAAVAAIALAARLALREIDSDALRTRIERALARESGLDVSLGELAVSLWPTPGLDARNVVVSRGPDRPPALRLQAAEIRIGLEPWPLLRRAVVVEGISIEDAELHVETGGDAPASPAPAAAAAAAPAAAADAGSGDAAPRIELRRLELENLRVFVRDARSGTTTSGTVESATAEDHGHEIELSAHGRFDGSEVSVEGRIGSLREWIEPSKPFPVDLSGQLFEASYRAVGHVDHPQSLSGLDLEISGEIPELELQGRPLPEVGRLRFRGRLSNPDGPLRLDLPAPSALESDRLKLAVHGQIDDLLELAGIDVEAQIGTGSLDFLAPFLEPRLGIPWPKIASASARARLADRAGSLGLDGELDLATPGQAIVLHARGGVADLQRTPSVDLALDGRAADLADVAALFPDVGFDEPTGPVTARARLVGHLGKLAARDVSVRAGSRQTVWAEADGSIADLAGLHGVDLTLAFGADSLHRLSSVVRRTLPHTSPVQGTAGISDADGSLGIEHLHLHGGEGGPVEVQLEARFDDLPARDEIEVDLALRGQDTQVLGALAGVDLPAIAPVEIGGRIEGSDEHLEMRNLALRLGETRLAGSVAGSFAPGTRPSVTARLTSKAVRLEDLGIRPAPEESSDAARSGDGPPGVRLDRLPLEELRRVDVDLDAQLGRVRGAVGFDARDVRFGLRLRDGDLQVTDLGATYQGGKLSGQLRADARTPDARLAMQLQTKGMNLERLVSQFREDTKYSGVVDGEIDLRAEGATLEAIRRSLDGRLGLAVHDGTAVSRIAREFVKSLASAIFPGFHTREEPSIGCAIADLEIANGIATVHTLFLREKAISLTGTGRLDLVEGRVDMLVVPRTTDPAIVSLAPEVEVTGPITDPVFHPIKRTLLKSIGRGLVQNVFRLGGTLVRPLWRRSEAVTAQEEACRLSDPDAS